MKLSRRTMARAVVGAPLVLAAASAAGLESLFGIGAARAAGQAGEPQAPPPEPDEPPVARFLAKRGPGIHHICYRVPDLDRALDMCRRHGYQLVDQKPRTGAGGHRIAFLHPKSTAGILIELTE